MIYIRGGAGESETFFVENDNFFWVENEIILWGL